MVKLINSIIAEDNMENIRQYISRGRRFEHINIEALKQRWISAFKALASDIENYQALYEYIDADAEFQLRKIEPPRDTVKADTEKLVAAIPSKAEDPESWAKVRQAIGDGDDAAGARSPGAAAFATALRAAEQRSGTTPNG
jgi:hypothetical protein